MSRVLLTCPPMIMQRSHFDDVFQKLGWQVVVPEMEQTLSEAQLIETLPEFDGWIIGDDPATREVVKAGVAGRLKAAVKWGVGTDNVDFSAFAAYGVPVENTPGMFGKEVADVALGYVIALARHTFEIDRGIRAGKWPKPTGISLAEKNAVVVGFGDIGKNTAKRLMACEMRVTVCDPGVSQQEILATGCSYGTWPQALGSADFIVFTCALTPQNKHMLNRQSLGFCKPGVRIVNVARGPLIDEQALIHGLETRTIAGCALDVFEREPLEMPNPLRNFSANIFGSHNASNTKDAVMRTSAIAIEKLTRMLVQ